MKYLITESQIDNVIFKYLDNQDFIQIKNRESVYFVNSESDEYTQIRFDKDGRCYVSYDLYNEISMFFSLQDSDFDKVIVKWVENIIKMEVESINVAPSSGYTLRIPYYN
jgi:hypothetical protein